MGRITKYMDLCMYDCAILQMHGQPGNTFPTRKITTFTFSFPYYYIYDSSKCVNILTTTGNQYFEQCSKNFVHENGAVRCFSIKCDEKSKPSSTRCTYIHRYVCRKM